MTAQELEEIYTALSHALTEVGEAKASLLLATLALALLAGQSDAASARARIEQARQLATF